jgi:uncharacterized protein (TIGR02217 family)
MLIYPSVKPLNLGVRGVTWPITRSQEVSFVDQRVSSGKEQRLTYWTWPVHHWVIDYNYLYDYDTDASEYQLDMTANTTGDTDLRLLEGFWLQVQTSPSGLFFFEDPADNFVEGQPIATGDGSTTSFQLVRTLGGFIEPMQAPNTGQIINVYLAGVLQSPSTYALSASGLLTFNSAPGAGVAITADFYYYFNAHFEDEKIDYEEFMFRLHELKSVKIKSVKL